MRPSPTKSSKPILSVDVCKGISSVALEIVYNTESNELRIIICLRNSKVSVIRISMSNIIENKKENGIHIICHAPIPMTS